mgnify:CR=1 FL=1
MAVEGAGVDEDVQVAVAVEIPGGQVLVQAVEELGLLLLAVVGSMTLVPIPNRRMLTLNELSSQAP